mmetsp:Transcript_18589/g.35805  ORF Transcript_18589/g.35805 Transcript_18589/m.35805 type:complete len:271 (+) Transcript_18589:312-1124(+)
MKDIVADIHKHLVRYAPCAHDPVGHVRLRYKVNNVLAIYRFVHHVQVFQAALSTLHLLRHDTVQHLELVALYVVDLHVCETLTDVRDRLGHFQAISDPNPLPSLFYVTPSRQIDCLQEGVDHEGPGECDQVNLLTLHVELRHLTEQLTTEADDAWNRYLKQVDGVRDIIEYLFLHVFRFYRLSKDLLVTPLHCADLREQDLFHDEASGEQLGLEVVAVAKELQEIVYDGVEYRREQEVNHGSRVKSPTQHEGVFDVRPRQTEILRNPTQA